jgi:hypothetical protein
MSTLTRTQLVLALRLRANTTGCARLVRPTPSTMNVPLLTSTCSNPVCSQHSPTTTKYGLLYPAASWTRQGGA